MIVEIMMDNSSIFFKTSDRNTSFFCQILPNSDFQNTFFRNFCLKKNERYKQLIFNDIQLFFKVKNENRKVKKKNKL